MQYFCGRLRKISQQILVEHIKHQRENSVTFLDFQISQSSVATYCRLDGNLCQFSYESPGERILKIGLHLPKRQCIVIVDCKCLTTVLLQLQLCEVLRFCIIVFVDCDRRSLLMTRQTWVYIASHMQPCRTQV